ncbi:MAG: thioredoxin domain-containing protein [Bacteroidetes bacterium]|nr:MAG: thioredoxin domain-containing protein [Bacteroidota bacterium]
MNRLQYETSPYLLQHAHNPVDWYAWKPEAFEKARKEDKPILVSIGYSTCHWCHVMERESFENEEVAAFMNEHFVNIKVDREERPDVDQIYMEVCQVISGSGGWPLNCFLLPDGRPFFAGTYYPPRPAYNRPSWLQVLQNLSEAYRTRREVVEKQAERLVEALKQTDNRLISNALEVGGAVAFGAEDARKIYERLSENFDWRNGGFGGAPKFPGTMNLEFFLQYGHDFGEEKAFEQVAFSLEKMIRGGIYDQIGGGFARYAVDDKWLVPHFEKMLYDNALLVGLMSEMFKKQPDPLFRETIEDTLGWVEREMTSPEGGFYSALDADSEGEEGRFYVWGYDEIREILGDLAPDFCDFYGVVPGGNWEGKSILHRKISAEKWVAQKQSEGRNLTLEDFKAQMKAAARKLLAHRETRIRPGLDDKILLDWNALQCTAFARAYTALGVPRYKETALRNLDFLRSHFADPSAPGALFHTWKDGEAKYAAFLDDYAFLIEALLAVYEISFDTEWLKQAVRYTDYVLENFLDPTTNLCYFTSKSQSDLILRKKEIYDSAKPSGNAVMAHNLQKLAILFDRNDYREQATKMLGTMKATVEKYPSSFGRWATALLAEIKGFTEVAIVGPDFATFANQVNKYFIPHKILMASATEVPGLPLLEGRKAENDTLVYICRNYACLRPVKTIEAFRQLVAANES